MKNIPLIVQFIGTIIIVIVSIELGHRAGNLLQRRKKNEKGPMVSVISSSILGLLAFILAFTFGTVSDRFDARKSLVREEANQIGTLWLRTDFISEPERSETRKLIRDYLALRIDLNESLDDEHVQKAMAESVTIQQQLWTMAIRHSQTDLRSDIGALYFESLNKLIDIENLRIAVAYKAHLPRGLWISLFILLVFGMLCIGYYAAITESTRNFATLILAFSFSLVIFMISNLDQLQSNYFKISQQPLTDLQAKIAGQ